jgi:predicted O-methyltransferase YrrM
MTVNGTGMHDQVARHGYVPPLVLDAVAVAKRLGFNYSVHPATGRLLASLASGIAHGVIGETGTGTGAGVAWMASTAPPGTRIVSIELDERRAAVAEELFAGQANISVLHGDANGLADHGPFDLLVLDAPPTPGPLHWHELDPTVQLTPNGVLVKDDLWPMTSWPPTTVDGALDEQRVRWFEHPDLLATEVTVAPGCAVQIARRRPS